MQNGRSGQWSKNTQFPLPSVIIVLLRPLLCNEANLNQGYYIPAASLTKLKDEVHHNLQHISIMVV